jgi:hypothetical protein
LSERGRGSLARRRATARPPPSYLAEPPPCLGVAGGDDEDVIEGLRAREEHGSKVQKEESERERERGLS